ncbi:MAG: TetR family transcriptional regulator [Aeromicrobium sp.]|jgi:AcrR family transcriptional regulator|uniref:TetR/AcrR family transcriptional regulator n=1 Tax=Aeromicrobium sp. TaxID=1871063 RepID=UPI00261E4B94|nr:TetR/AcrR family transcriptional regulator [Aeromicrobium sp.]MCW2788341.1 TetR family transcriptional regulator [Aeromicrobium sp.]MCW2825713.1 TetR family transcriptional regulator [Aeromicrobium sp.]
MATTTQMSGRTAVLRDAIVEIILAEGFLGVQMSDLAARLNCSKSTLYAIAPSKEQLLVAVVRTFFRRATERVEQAVDPEAPAIERIGAYLNAVAVELAPASPAFFADLERFTPAGDIYRQNTQIAAARIQDLVLEAAPGIDPKFLGVVVRLMMESIHRGDISRATGLDDSAAYRALAELILAGLSGGPTAPTTPHPMKRRKSP